MSNVTTVLQARTGLRRRCVKGHRGQRDERRYCACDVRCV